MLDKLSVWVIGRDVSQTRRDNYYAAQAGWHDDLAKADISPRYLIRICGHGDVRQSVSPQWR